MENFNFKRFWNVFKYDFETVKRQLYIPYAIITLSFLALALILFYGFKIYHLTWGDFVIQGLICLIVGFSIYSSSRLCAFMGNNSQRISVLIRPATHLELFTSRMVVYWLIPCTFSLVVFFLSPIGIEDVVVHTAAGDFNNTLWYEYRLAICGVVCTSGIMILMSSIFHKNVLLKTLLVILGLIVVINVIGYAVDSLFSKTVLDNGVALKDDKIFIVKFLDWISKDNFRISVFQIVIEIIVMAVCSFFAYRRFTRLTLKS